MAASCASVRSCCARLRNAGVTRSSRSRFVALLWAAAARNPRATAADGAIAMPMVKVVTTVTINAVEQRREDCMPLPAPGGAVIHRPRGLGQGSELHRLHFEELFEAVLAVLAAVARLLVTTK